MLQKLILYCTIIAQYNENEFFHCESLFLLQINSQNNAKNKIEKNQDVARPVTHLKSKVTINMLTDMLFMPRKNIPQEIVYFMKITPDQKFLPIITYNFLETRLSDLKLMKNSTEEILLKYEPTYFGEFFFILLIGLLFLKSYCLLNNKNSKT